MSPYGAEVDYIADVGSGGSRSVGGAHSLLRLAPHSRAGGKLLVSSDGSQHERPSGTPNATRDAELFGELVLTPPCLQDFLNKVD